MTRKVYPEGKNLYEWIMIAVESNPRKTVSSREVWKDLKDLNVICPLNSVQSCLGRDLIKKGLIVKHVSVKGARVRFSMRKKKREPENMLRPENILPDELNTIQVGEAIIDYINHIKLNDLVPKLQERINQLILNEGQLQTTIKEKNASITQLERILKRFKQELEKYRVRGGKTINLEDAQELHKTLTVMGGSP